MRHHLLLFFATSQAAACLASPPQDPGVPWAKPSTAPYDQPTPGPGPDGPAAAVDALLAGPFTPDARPAPPFNDGAVLAGTDALGPSEVPGRCALAVSVTTILPPKGYSPKNVGAIWIQDGAGKFVKTLAVWAKSEVQRLTAWTSVTGGAGVPRDKTDAITSATAPQPGLRMATWNCTTFTRAPAPDGPYSLCVEITQHNGSGPMNCVAFTKGSMPVKVMPPDTPNFTLQSLVFTP